MGVIMGQVIYNIMPADGVIVILPIVPKWVGGGPDGGGGFVDSPYFRFLPITWYM